MKGLSAIVFLVVNIIAVNSFWPFSPGEPKLETEGECFYTGDEYSSPEALAFHPGLRPGTMLKVFALDTHKSIIVPVDGRTREAPTPGRVLELSAEALHQLQVPKEDQVFGCRFEILPPPSQHPGFFGWF